MPKAPHKSITLSSRLNAVHPEEASAISIIQGWKDQGIGLRAGLVDAINRSKGITPEVFIHERGEQESRYVELTEEVFSKFAEQLMQEIRKGGVRVSNREVSDDDDGSVTTFAKTFVTGLKQRQQQAQEIEEE